MEKPHMVTDGYDQPKYITKAGKGKERDKWNNLPFPSDDCLPLFFEPVFYPKKEQN